MSAQMKSPESTTTSNPLPSGQSPSPLSANPPHGNPLEALAAAFEEAQKGGKPPEGEGHPAPADGKPKVLADLGALLKIEPADLYKVQVPSSRDGAEPYTLGQLKDLALEHDGFAVRQLELEENHRSRMADVMRAEQELQDIMATLPADAIKPEARGKLQARRDAALVKERQLVLDAIPEWKNPAVRTQEIEEMIEHLKDYGFPPGYLSSVYDHRTLRYIRANWQRAKQIQAALEKVRERKPNTPPKGQKSDTKPRISNVPSGNGSGSFGSIIQNANRR